MQQAWKIVKKQIFKFKQMYCWQEKYISKWIKMQSVNQGEVTSKISNQTVQSKVSSSVWIAKSNQNDIEQISKDQNKNQKTDIFQQSNPINSLQRIILKQVQSKQTKDFDQQDQQAKNIIIQGFESCLNKQNTKTNNRLSSSRIFPSDYHPFYQPHLFSAANTTTINTNNTVQKHQNLFQTFKNEHKSQYKVKFDQSYAESMAFVNRVRQSKSRDKQNLQTKQVQELRQISLKRKPSIKYNGRYSQTLINTQGQAQKIQQSNSKTMIPLIQPINDKKILIPINQNQQQNSPKQQISQNKNSQSAHQQNTLYSEQQKHFLTKICKFDMKKLSDVEKATLVVEIFNTYDVNQDGVLDRQQASQMLKAYSQDENYIPSEKQIINFFKSFNCKSTYFITSDQMYQYMQNIRNQDSEEQLEMERLKKQKKRIRCNKSGPSAPIVKVSGSGNMQVSVTINQYQRIEENVRINPRKYEEKIRQQEQNIKIKKVKHQLEKERRLRLKQQKEKNKLQQLQLKQLQIQDNEEQSSIKSQKIQQKHKNQSNTQKVQQVIGQKNTITMVNNNFGQIHTEYNV